MTTSNTPNQLIQIGNNCYPIIEIKAHYQTIVYMRRDGKNLITDSVTINEVDTFRDLEYTYDYYFLFASLTKFVNLPDNICDAMDTMMVDSPSIEASKAMFHTFINTIILPTIEVK